MNPSTFPWHCPKSASFVSSFAITCKTRYDDASEGMQSGDPQSSTKQHPYERKQTTLEHIFHRAHCLPRSSRWIKCQHSERTSRKPPQRSGMQSSTDCLSVCLESNTSLTIPSQGLIHTFRGSHTAICEGTAWSGRGQG